jgi:hypothetical protein
LIGDEANGTAWENGGAEENGSESGVWPASGSESGV